MSAKDDGANSSGEAQRRRGIDRRDFLKIAGVSAGAVAVSCDSPQRVLYSSVDPPRNAPAGVASFYSSLCRECPAGCGVYVRVREGRPVKLEGNAQHPVNQGALCARGQAGLLRTFGHQRLEHPRDHDGARLSWRDAYRRIGEAIESARAVDLGRVLVWTGLETGTLYDLYSRFTRAVAGEHIMFEPHQVEPVLAAHQVAFGQLDYPRYALGECDLVLALEADIFETYHSPVEIARQVVGPGHQGEHRAKLIWAGPRRGVTGMLADHWVPIRPGTAGVYALALVGELLASGGGAMASAAARYPQLDGLLRALPREDLARRAGIDAAELQAVARQLSAANRPVVLPPGPLGVGPHGVAEQLAVVLLNTLLGAYGQSLIFDAPSALASITPSIDIRAALERMRSGDIDVLIVADQNPLFDLPRGLDVESALQHVDLKVAITDRMDSTAQLADIVLPASSPLESWGDYSPRVGVAGLMQPVLEPIFQTRMAGDIVIDLARAAGVRRAVVPRGVNNFETALRRRWAATHGLGGQAAEARFQETQRRGFDTQTPEAGAEVAPALELQPAIFEQIQQGLERELAADDEIVIAPYAPIGSGLAEQASGAWLDELPEPTTAAVWGSPAELHPDTARTLGVAAGDTIEIESEATPVRLPVVIHEAVRPGVVAIPVGGRTEQPANQWPEAPSTTAQPVNPADFTASSQALLLPGTAFRDGEGVIRSGHAARVSRSGQAVTCFLEARHFDQHGRNIARAQGVEVAGHGPVHDLPIMGSGGDERGSARRRRTDMYGAREYTDHRWAMAIDLDKCTGCSACVVACYAENNISVVGPEHVDYGREMHWLQIHTYWERDHADRPIPLFLPMLCQHCHQAPCESVCPVYAPYHTPEGLNGQVYNRCVGTRFCSNNCPYKVRRFNWYDWPLPEPMHLQLNPDVTFRTAGVMEKCTFCIQRIREAKEEAKLADREMEDGDVVPACVQTCPTGALVFGDWLDEESRLRQLVESQQDRGYHVLGHVGTRPAITYLERVVRWRNS